MPIAYSYARFSSGKQKLGVSLERQLELAERYAATHGLILDNTTYRDLGVSAFRGKNAAQGALGAFLKAVEAGTIPKGAFLLVENLDRLSRAKPREALKLFERIVDLGIVLVTLHDEAVYSLATLDAEPNKLYVVLGHLNRAHDESKTKSKRGYDAIDRRVLRGELRAPRLPTWLKPAPDRKSAIIIPEIAAIVKQVFDWTLEGIGGREIAQRLNDQGVKPFRTAPFWRQSAVSQVLHNHAAYGAFVPITGNGEGRTRGEPQEGVYPTVVSKADWIRAQQMIAARAKFKGGFGRNNPNNIFGGLSRCGHCGAVMRFLPQKPWYLRCVDSTELKRCVGRMFNFAASEAALVYEFAHRLDKHVGKVFFAQQNSRREELEHEMATLEVQQDKLLEISAETDAKAVGKKMNQLQAQIDKATAELRTLSTFTTSRQEQHENAAMFDIYLRLIDEELADWNPHGDGVKDILEYRRKFKNILARTVNRLEFKNGDDSGKTWQPQIVITYVSDTQSVVELMAFMPERTQKRVANGIHHQTHRARRNDVMKEKSLNKKSG